MQTVPRRKFLTAAGIAVLSCRNAAAAQEPETQDMRALLDRVVYDPNERGPLLIVAPPRAFVSTRFLSKTARLALETVANSAGYGIVVAGGLTCVVPRQMTVIVTNPGKANPYAGMDRDDLARVLMASLSPGQWEALCGEGGIGIGDLSGQQRLIFDRLVPNTTEVVHQITERPDPEQNKVVDRVLSRTPVDRNMFRLRISRQACFWFPTGPNGSVGTNPLRNPEVGETRDVLAKNPEPEREDLQNPLSPIAYGQTILKAFPNQTKPSDLDFRAPVLDIRIALPDSGGGGAAAPRLGDLVQRVARATGLDLIADRRVASRDVYARGTSARAGDILEALCRSVTGTFRRVGKTQTFVLTDDREGIGARYGRLAEWAGDAETAKADLIAQANDKIKKAKIVSKIRFQPGDPFTPSVAQQARLEDGWRSSKSSYDFVTMDDLSTGLRRNAQKAINSFQSSGDPRLEAIQTDSFHMSIGMHADWIVPGLGPLPDYDMLGLLGPSLGEFVEKDPVSSPAPSASKAAATPNGPQRRILLARATAPNEATALLASAQQHGFNEIWFQVGMDNLSETTSLLRAAVAAGKEHTIAVGAALDLLRGPGIPGEPDRNILGETSTEFAKRMATRPSPIPLHGYEGWVVPEGNIGQIAERVSQVASVPGLACVSVRAAAPPGCVRIPVTDDDRTGQRLEEREGLPINGRLGYSDSRRIAFLRANGIDPIDIPELGILHRYLSLPFFPSDTNTSDKLWEGPLATNKPDGKLALAEWREFRYRQTETAIAALYEALRRTNPPIPLLIDDSASSYIRDLWASWFVTWDQRVGLSRNRVHYTRAEAIKQLCPLRNNAAPNAAPIVALTRTAFPEDRANPVTIPQFVTRVADSAAYAAHEGWDGVVVEQTAPNADELLRRLAALPVLPNPMRSE